MKEITYQVKKLVLTKEEKEVKKSWSTREWNMMKKTEDLLGHFLLNTGTWSGYPGQANCDTTSYKHVSLQLINSRHPYSGIIEFSDNTFLRVEVIQMTIKELLEKGISKKSAYTELVEKLFKYGNAGYYNVAQDQ